MIIRNRTSGSRFLWITSYSRSQTVFNNPQLTYLNFKPNFICLNVYKRINKNAKKPFQTGFERAFL